MNIIPTALEGVFILEPKVFPDDRGWFMETFRQSTFAENVCRTEFVQENESFSRKGVIRGLHAQLLPYAQSKLVRVAEGRIIDVAVDIRRDSPTFGQHVAVELSSENRKQLFVPRGFAHGFSVLSDTARVIYKCDGYYGPGSETAIVYNDPHLGIDWQVPPGEVVISDKDAASPLLKDARVFGSSKGLY